MILPGPATLCTLGTAGRRGTMGAAAGGNRIALTQELPRRDAAHLVVPAVVVDYWPDKPSLVHSHPCPVLGHVTEDAVRIPVKVVLAHEIIHYNRTGQVFGQPVEEGLADIGARSMVVKYKILTEYSLTRVDTYSIERKGIELVLEEIIKRTGLSHDEAVDLFLGALLTGNQESMNEVFGADTWGRVIKLSYTQGDWQTQRIKAALAE